MNWLTNAWKWLSNTKNQKTIAFIGSGLVIVVTGVWQGYLHLYEPNQRTHSLDSAAGKSLAVNGNITQTPDRGGNAIITTGDVKIGMSDENVIKLITTIVKENHLDSKTDKEQITNLTLAVEYLNANTFNLGSNEEVTDALKKLSQGDSTKTKELYLRIATDTNKIPNQ